MTDTPVVTVEGLSKKFCRRLKRSLWYGACDLANEVLARPGRRHELRRHEFWALRDMSFELHKGETLGVVGHNGAGKTTLLRLLNGLIKPDTGRIRLRGRVGALIQLGAGFSAILTGRENIYINGAVLGLGKKEIDRRLDEIIDFAEIGDFIDAPVQTYSSGMKVRLGFSIASHMRPDILLIDEILAVGDSSFRERCYNRFTEFKSYGGTIIFISHNSAAIESVCDRAMMLDHGRVVDVGDPYEIVHRYESEMLELSRRAGVDVGAATRPNLEDDIWITDVEYYDRAGVRKSELQLGESFEIRLHYETDQDIRFPHFVVALRKGTRQNPFVTVITMLWDGIGLESIPRRGVIGCVLENPALSPGVYSLHAGVQAKASARLGKKWYAPLRECGSFTVQAGSLRHQLPGLSATDLVAGMPPLMVAHSWSLNGMALSAARSTAPVLEP